MSAGPVRRCVACGAVRPKPELIRLVCDGESRVRVDPVGTAPGRGAYVCPTPACLDGAIARRRLAHAFRKPCAAGADLVEEVRGLWRHESR